MKIKEIGNIKVDNKERYIKAFIDLIKSVKSNCFNYQDKEYTDYLIINENRLNSHFIHIVPKEILNTFNKIKDSNPEQFLGFSIFLGKYNDKEVRVSCFGIPCSDLTRAIIN
ncbi:MAG: hypothetical protein AABW80_02140 [Nanoarchaeota archaeon]